MADGKSNYEVNIRTSADLKAAEDYKRAIQAAAKAAQDAGQATEAYSRRLAAVDSALQSNTARALKLEDAVKRVAAAEKGLGKSSVLGNGITLTTALGKGVDDVRALNQQLRGLGESTSMFSALGGGLTGLLKSTGGQLLAFTGISLTAAGAFRAVSSAIQNYSQSEDALVKMQLALASQGKYSKEAAQSIADLAGEFEKSTNIGDTVWLESLTRLIQYGGRVDEVDKLGKTLKNLAGLMDGDVQGAATMMIKALNGSYRGFELLGFQIDKNASDLENWISIVNQSERGAGMLEKMTKTLSGTWASAAVALGNFEKAAASTYTGLLATRGIATGATIAFNYLADKIGFTIPKVEGLNNQKKVLTRTTEDLADSVGRGADRLKQMGDAAEKTKKQIDAVRDAIRTMASLDEDELSAKMNFELALADDEEARTGNRLGGMRKRASIRSRYARAKNDVENQSDIADLTIGNAAASRILSRRNYLAGSVQYYEGKGDSANAAKARNTLKDFDDTEMRLIPELGNSGIKTFAKMQSRNRVYGYDVATGAVKNNAEERSLRDEVSRNLGNGAGTEAFRDLAAKSAFIPGAIAAAQGASQLITQLAQSQLLTTDQLQSVAKMVAEINARQKAGRNFQQ